MEEEAMGTENGGEQASAKQQPGAKFGKHVASPPALGGTPVLPCKRPGKKWEEAEWGDKYGEATTLGGEIKNGIVTAWTHVCQPSLRQLRFFQELYVEGRARVFGLQHRTNPAKGVSGEAAWEDGSGVFYSSVVGQKGITFPQFAIHEGNLNQIQWGAGVPPGKETYPFTAVVADGKVVYYATGQFWDERLDWEGLQARGEAATAIKERREEFKARKEELLSVVKYYLAPE